MDEVTPETPITEPSGDSTVVPLPDVTAEPVAIHVDPTIPN